MTTAKLSLFCPRMKVVHDGPRRRKTYAEPMVATLTFESGTEMVIQPVTIPPTLVDKITETHWRVQACVGQGVDALGNRLAIDLPPQDVVFDILKLKLVAKQLPASGTMWFAGGVVGEVQVVWPDCPVDLYDMTAEACTAVGTVTY